MLSYFTKNLWGYEKLTPPPKNLPKQIKTFYLTDDINYKDSLLKAGWDVVIINDEYKKITDQKTRRKIISEINCFPSKFIDEINNFDFVFVSDSNIDSLWDKYSDFVSKCKKDKCLFLVHGWYAGIRNTIRLECEKSMQRRWEYDHENIRKSSEKYLNEIKSLGIDETTIPVYSAKYFGWNIKHPMYETISKKFYEEYMNHLQGNIILSYLSVIYSDYTFSYEYKKDENPSGKINKHNFSS